MKDIFSLFLCQGWITTNSVTLRYLTSWQHNHTRYHWLGNAYPENKSRGENAQYKGWPQYYTWAYFMKNLLISPKKIGNVLKYSSSNLITAI